MSNTKTNEDRILRIIELSEDYFGKDDVKFVGLKYDCERSSWIAKLQLKTHLSIYESANSSDEALKKLKNRVKKIIKRYNLV